MSEPGLKSGTIVGDRYEVDRLLGQGEFGLSYLCRDLMNEGKGVTLRLMTGWPVQGGMEPLRQALSFLSCLRHPHLAHLLDFGIADRNRVPFLVRQYVDGVEICQATADWGVDAILSQLVQLCRVLHYLHGRGVVHRRLKPSNVLLVSVKGASPETQLLDCGMGFQPGMGDRISAELSYVAPEILLGHTPNPRSDLYSFGILAYQLLTRRLPFDDEDRGYLIQKHLQGRADMRPVERLKGGTGLVQVLLSLLEKDPEKRPSSAEDVIRLLSVAGGRDYSGSLSDSKGAYFSAGRFVGREKEMAFIQERAVRVRGNGRGRTVFITGESGSGKSRCMEELRTWALLEGWRVVESGCLPREDKSYGPYRRILARAGSLRPAASAGKNEGAIFRFEDSVCVPDASPLEFSAGAAAGPFRDLLTRELIRLLSDRPTLLILHDFHWAEEETVAVLDYITNDILVHPILMCVSLRPADAEHGPLAKLLEVSVRQHRADLLALEALPAPAVADLIAGITGEAGLAGEIGSWVHKASGGNPFFVEEILKHLVDREVLRRELGSWRLARKGLENQEVPASVAEVLRRRLAQLSPQAAVITQWLALFRRAVHRGQLRVLSAMDERVFEERLRELTARQIVREVSSVHEDTCEFRHALISEVIAEDMPMRQKRRMHRKIGELLEQQCVESEVLQELATHYTEGRGGEKAVRYALKAARACRVEFANDAAVRFYEYVLASKQMLSAEQMCDVCIEAADTYCALGNPKRAIRILTTQPNNKLRFPELPLKIRNLVGLSVCYQYKGEIQTLEKLARHGLNTIKRADDQRYRRYKASLLKQLAYSALVKSRPQKALVLLNAALDAISNIHENGLHGQIYSLISAAQRVACDIRSSIAAAQQAVEILNPLQALPILATAYSHLGVGLAAIGKFDKAQENHALAVSLSERTRDPILRSQALGNLAECQCRAGKIAEAQKAIDSAYALALETANLVVLQSVMAIMAEIKLAGAQYLGTQSILNQLTAHENEKLCIYSKGHVFYLCAQFAFLTSDYDSASRYLEKLRQSESIEAPAFEREIAEVITAKILADKGHFKAALNILFRFDEAVTKKKWRYHRSIINLAIGEVLIEAGDFANALIYLKRGSRLARGIQCLHLQAQSQMLIVDLLTKRSELQYSIIEGTLGPSQLEDKLTTALSLAETAGTKETVWKIFILLARLRENIGDRESALSYLASANDHWHSITSGLSKNQIDLLIDHRERHKYFAESQKLLKILSQNRLVIASDGYYPEERHFAIIYRFVFAINTTHDLAKIINITLGTISSAIKADRIIVVLKDNANNKLRLAGKLNYDADSLESLPDIEKYIICETNESMQPFVTADTLNDARLCQLKITGSESHAIFCSPLVVIGHFIGSILAKTVFSKTLISESLINLFAAICNLASVAIDNAMQRQDLVNQNEKLVHLIYNSKKAYSDIIGESNAIARLRERIRLAAASPLDILISGESGTGKELVARALHRTGRRSNGTFVAVDCGALSESIFESEMFGHKKGAFSGALENRAGIMEIASGGVIFLDEISNLTLNMQKKLLRVLQEQEIRRLGENNVRKVDVQIVAASNRDLRVEIEEGRFRDDLFYRLRKMEIQIPPLRERTDDIPLLVEYFMGKVAANEGGVQKRLEAKAYDILLNYGYPGNVRELKNIIEEAYYSASSDVIKYADISNIVFHGTGLQNGVEKLSTASKEYSKIKLGYCKFHESVKIPFMRRQIDSNFVRQIMHLALLDAKGRYREAFRILGIEEKQYAGMMEYLKRNHCYLNFHEYRK